MKVSWIRLSLFGLAGTVGLGLLAWYDPPPRKHRVDRHTGQELDRFGRPIALRRMRNPADVLAEARATADPVRALAMLKGARRDLPSATQFRSLEHRLAAETLSPADLADAVAAWDPISAGEMRDAIAMADLALQEQRDEALTPLTLVELLRAREHDTDIARSTEVLFQPLTGQRRTTLAEVEAAVKAQRTPDLIAALTLAMRDESDDDRLEAALITARAFRAAGRPRARLRWLLRAFAGRPGDERTVFALHDAYVEHGDLLAATAILDSAALGGMDTARLWRQRLQLATWGDRQEQRVRAMEELVRVEDSPELREELIAIHTYLGAPLRALPHALAIAEATQRPEHFHRAAQIAFGSDLLEDGFDLLDRAAAVADDPRPWQRMWMDLKLHNLEVDAVIERLLLLLPTNPEYEAELEILLRRRSRTRDLAELLAARRQRAPTPELDEELTYLWTELGQTDRVRDLEEERLRRVADPLVYFERLRYYRLLALDGVLEVGARMVASPELTEEHFDAAAFALVEASESDPRFLPLLEQLALRFPHLPAAAQYMLALVDQSGDAAAAAARAEEVWQSSPESRPFLLAWIDRAAWAELPESELRARGELRRQAPNDVVNRRRVADLLESMHRLREALEEWRAIVAADGPGSESETRLLMLLETLDMEEEALAILAGREARGELSIEQRIELAERFFGAERLARSLELFETVLAQEPDNVSALLRAGQIRSWSNDPSGAVPYFVRLIEISGDADGQALFLLGDAYWATQREEEGGELLRRAMPLLRNPETLTRDRESMLAKTLSRLGHTDESRAIYERLVAAEPKNQGLLLDFADGMVAGGRLDVARTAVDRARELAPKARRLLRLDGQLRIEERRYAEAVAALTETLELYGPDAGTYADLGRAHEALGNWGAARVALGYSLQLQPRNGDVAFVHRVISDRLSDRTVELHARSSSVDEDSTFDFVAEATMLLEEDHTRGSARISQASYSGRARAVARGLADVDSDVTTLSFSACRRFREEWEIGGGLDFYAGREDAAPVGLWVAGGQRTRDPFRQISARLHINEPLRDPAAAVGLGGSSSGLDATVFRETEDQLWWWSGIAGYRTLSLEHPRKGEIRDGQGVLELALGRWIENDGPDIHERLDVRQCPSTFEGTTVIGETPASTGPRIAVWAAYSGLRLLDDQELARAVPIGEEFDYLTVTGRVVDAVGMGLRYEVQGTLGTDLAGSGSVVNIAVTGAWRPHENTEVRLGLSYGRALGRAGGDDAIGVELGAVFRW